MPSNALDLDLHDLDLLEEIGLVTELMAAAEHTGRRLSVHEVDAVLFGDALGPTASGSSRRGLPDVPLPTQRSA